MELFKGFAPDPANPHQTQSFGHMTGNHGHGCCVPHMGQRRREKMKALKYLALAAGLTLVLSPVFAQSDAPARATATLHGIDGASLGMATLMQAPHGVLIEINAEKLTPGRHAIHIHERGQCDPAMGFESAGDHFAPGSTAHGYMAAQGPHAGDMPNQVVGADGKLQAGMFNSNVTLMKGANSLFDNDGSAIVIHAGADDYRSQPSGDSGDRAACGVIRRS
jgi:Cu-Zn family superoxide dismutase